MSRIHVRVTVSADTRNIAALLAKLTQVAADPGIFVQLLRQAIAETFLVAFRQRFMAGLPDAINTLLADTDNKSPGTIEPELRQALTETLRDYTTAQLAGDRESARAAHGRLNRLSTQLARQLKPSGRSSSLSSGTYRQLALEIMAMLTEANELGVHAGGGSITVGIGKLAELDAIVTPSFRPTSSKQTLMFRQLEFGTGVFASDPTMRDPASQASLPDGSWWYGKRPGNRIRLKGAPGIHALWDPRGLDGAFGNKVMYAEDGLRFEQVFAALMHQALTP